MNQGSGYYVLTNEQYAYLLTLNLINPGDFHQYSGGWYTTDPTYADYCEFFLYLKSVEGGGF